jgi:S-DNA-T family DNA segregation ATPase FtsK/SpoIIIE
VEHWKGQRGRVPTAVNLEPPPEPEPADDDVSRARDLAAHHSRVSASLLQRKLGIGYAKAASLLDHLEEMGVVGPGDPGKSRTVIGSE